jgi:hypothetical protein
MPFLAHGRGAAMFKRITQNPAHISETILPLSSVSTDGPKNISALKLPRRINRVCK